MNESGPLTECAREFEAKMRAAGSSAQLETAVGAAIGKVTIENPNAGAVPLPAGEYRDRTLSLGEGCSVPPSSSTHSDTDGL
jgi:hypothetical protein